VQVLSSFNIQNKEELALTENRRAALDIIEAGIDPVPPPVILQKTLQIDSRSRTLNIQGDIYPLAGKRVIVIGGGKASARMARSLESIIGPENILAGVVACKAAIAETGKIEIIAAGHPLPDKRGVAVVNRMLGLKERSGIGEGDLVICLLSGGGSALLPCPAEGISLDDKQAVTGLLLASGADINEINIVRKHLSCTKGGQLGRYFAPATVVSLILSDVIGNDLSAIASGPTFPDNSTFAGAAQVLDKYGLMEKVPRPVLELLEKGRRGLIAETPKKLDNCRNYIIGDINLALTAMEQKAVEMGYQPLIISGEQSGDTAAAAALRAEQIMKGELGDHDVYLVGGETTIKVPAGAGKGGRNQHYAAVTLKAMKDYPGEWTAASVGTDGTDYLADAAGAIVDNQSARILQQQNLDIKKYLAACDSNTLLKRIGHSLVVTGDTGTNVCDVSIYVMEKIKSQNLNLKV
jgi:glycerate 2-kinase